MDTEVVSSPVQDANGVVIVQGKHLTGLFLNNVCAEVGDSGAPVYVEPAAVQNAPADAVGIILGGSTKKDASGKDVCLEKVNGPGTSVSYGVPLAAISAAATNPFTVKTGS